MSDPARRAPPLVLHICTVPESFGFLHGQLGYMRARGFEIALVASDGWYAAVTRELEGVPVYAVEMSRRITPLHDLRAIVSLVRLIRRLRPAIVHAHTPKGGLLGMIAAILARTPVRIYHMRGLPLETAVGVRLILLSLAEWLSCRLSHRVICVSSSLRDVAVRRRVLASGHGVVLAGGSGNGVDARIRFAPNASDGELRTATRELFQIPAAAVVVLFIGRVVADKGVTELFEAWRSVSARNPQAYLVIVGPEEPDDPVPQSILDALHADPRVCMTGLVRDTRPIFVISDVVVLPTYREGFPNVLLEAASMRLPAIATRTTGCVDAIVDDETGLLVPHKDPVALAAAIERYVRNPKLRHDHGNCGRKRVLEQFEQEHVWRALEVVYRDQLLCLKTPHAKR